jgi:glycerol kinase
MARVRLASRFPECGTACCSCITGMTLYTTKAHIARATLDAVAMQAREVLDAMEADSGVSLQTLQVDGGMTVNKLLMQLQADAVQVPVCRPENVETTAMGAAFAAGLAAGVWSKPEDLEALNPIDAKFTPSIDKPTSELKLAKWKDAVQRTLNLA